LIAVGGIKAADWVSDTQSASGFRQQNVYSRNVGVNNKQRVDSINADSDNIRD
jgi:hypothetical protein